MKLVPAVPFHSYSIFRPTTQLLRFNQLLSKNERELELKKQMARVFSSSVGWEVGSRGRPWLQVHVGLGACQPRQATELCRWSFSYFVQRRPVINIFLTWGSERVWLNQKMLSEEMLSLFCPVFEHNRCGERGVLGHCSCCWPSQLSSLVESGCGRRGMFVINSLIDLVASAELLRIIFLFL